MLPINSLRNLTVTAAVVLPTTLAFVSPARANLQNFVMRNNTGTSIARVFISPSNDDNWGPNRLNRRQIIRPGNSHRFNFTGFNECVFDIKVVFTDGDNSEKRGVDLCEINTFNVNE